jgi:hypothetical protein
VAWLLALISVWALAAYIVVPMVWKEYFRTHATLADGPRITHTADGHPGDAINVAIVGAEPDLVRAMAATGWFPADPITFDSSVRIVVDSVLRRPDDDAPVSNLFLLGRKQDLAFEQPVGDSPRQRHHVRFWRGGTLENGEPVWFGSATFDESVGVSHTTGQVTHHTGPDIDAERDLIVQELEKAGRVLHLRWIDNFHTHHEGTNGGGDPWHTDGRLAVIELRPSPDPSTPR